MGRRIPLTAGLAALLILSACTPDQPTRTDEGRTPIPAPEPATPTAGGSRQPLVLVTHATRRTREIDLATARRLIAGETGRWRLLDGSAGQLHLVGAPGTQVPEDALAGSAQAAIRIVERDRAAVAVVPASAVGPTVRAVTVAGVDPMSRPHAYPLTTDGPAPPVRTTTLTVVGDLMLTRGIEDPAAALEPMRRRLARADLTVGNLESTLSVDGRPRQGDDSFGAEPAVVGLLADAGFDALSLANNHTGDYQAKALMQTVRRLRASPIRPFGAGRDLAAAGQAAVIERDGVRFGFVGFNSIGETPRATPGRPGALSVRMPPRTGPLNRGDLAHVERLVERLDGRVDVVVMMPHWGTQYTHTPEPIQRRVAGRLVAAGADLIIGGHPHWVQGMDAHEGVVVAHSLGNFVFDMDFMTQTQQGVMLEATFWGSELKAVDLVPYRMDADFAPRPASPIEGARILHDVWANSTGPFSDR